MGEPKPDLSVLPTRRPRWLDELPSKLIWPRGEEPDLEIGDRIIVARHSIRYVAHGRRIAEDAPLIWLEITGIGQNKRFEHVFSYRIVGDETERYLAQTGKGDERGYTRSPAKSIDGDAPVLSMSDNSAIRERDDRLREIKRLEQLRIRHLDRLTRTTDERTRAVIVLSIGDIDRKVARLSRESLPTAA